MGEVVNIRREQTCDLPRAEVAWLAFVAAKRLADLKQTINAYRAAVEAYDHWRTLFLGDAR